MEYDQWLCKIFPQPTGRRIVSLNSRLLSQIEQTDSTLNSIQTTKIQTFSNKK